MFVISVQIRYTKRKKTELVWFAAKINYLMQLREVIENHTKHAKALCRMAC